MVLTVKIETFCLMGQGTSGMSQKLLWAEYIEINNSSCSPQVIL